MTMYCAPCITDLALQREAVTAVSGTACCAAHAVLLTHPQDNPGRRRARLAQLRQLAESKAETAPMEEQPGLELLIHEYTLAGAMDMGGQPRPDGSSQGRERGLRSDRPGGDRPGGDRPGGDRPGGDRPGGDRSGPEHGEGASRPGKRRNRGRGDRVPSAGVPGDRPTSDRPTSDRPISERPSDQGAGGGPVVDPATEPPADLAQSPFPVQGADSSTDALPTPPPSDVVRDSPPQDAPPQDAPPQDAPPQDAPPQDAPPQDAPPQDVPASDQPDAASAERVATPAEPPLPPVPSPAPAGEAPSAPAAEQPAGE